MLQNQDQFKAQGFNCRAEYASLPDDKKELFKQHYCCAVGINGQSSMVNVMRMINGKVSISYAEKAMILEIFQNFGVDEVAGINYSNFFLDHFKMFQTEIKALNSNTQEND